MTIRLEIAPTDTWADTVAGAWVERLEANPGLRMCLPTGATPRPVYERIAGLADFSRSTVFLLDEFGLPPDDPARCDRMLRRDLFDRLDAQPAGFDRLDPGADDLDEECARFAATLDEGGLDLVMLGLGGNGHLGLNEPGSTPDAPTRVVELAPSTREGLARYGARTDTTWGMTIGMAELLAASEVWLLVSGPHKRQILRRFLDDPVGPDLPATWLRPHGQCVVWADSEAGGALAHYGR